MPHPRFAGKSTLGPRGDVILQFDWCAGEILGVLDRLNLTANTLVILTSDNGPVIDDGYRDEAVEKLSGHTPSGPLRGGKYSAFDAGTRVPFLVRWPGRIPTGDSEALVSQIDFPASLAALTGRKLSAEDAPDSFDILQALLGKAKTGRDHLVEQAGSLSVVQGDWKYIEPGKGAKIEKNTNIELGNDPQPQLYNLADDIGEKENLAARYPERVEQMAGLLKRIREQGRSRR